MKRVLCLSDAEQAALGRAYQQSGSHRERQRAHAVLLSAQGYTLDQLAGILGSDRDTISRWLDRWQASGVAGLADAPRPGRPPKIDVQLEQALREILGRPSPNLKAALLNELKKGVTASWDTVRRALRRMGYSYRRARRVAPKSPDPGHRARVERALGRFERLEGRGKCQILYGDESGFCLQPCLPYLWQKVGQPAVGLAAQAHGERYNVLGLLRPGDCALWHFATTAKLTADFVIASIESLLPTLSAPTVLVLDNAGVHRSKAVRGKRREWKRRGLRLLFLPPYSPHLNKIEALWRQVKYRWLEPTAYQSFARLYQAVRDVLALVGTKYRITFA